MAFSKKRKRASTSASITDLGEEVEELEAVEADQECVGPAGSKEAGSEPVERGDCRDLPVRAMDYFVVFFFHHHHRRSKEKRSA